jgi:hypothetical protein
MRPPPETCPACGAAVPRSARACPECGSDEKTGWSEEAASDGLDLPAEEDEFYYDDFVKREFGGSDPKPRGLSWFWWVAGMIILAAFVILALH